MIKAVLWSRLAMMRDNIRNTHMQVLWEKRFRGETLLVLVTKYHHTKTSSQRLMLHYTRLLIRLLYIKGDSYATVHTAPSVKRTRDRTSNMHTRAYQGGSYTLNTYQTNFIHSWTVLQIQLFYHYNN